MRNERGEGGGTREVSRCHTKRQIFEKLGTKASHRLRNKKNKNWDLFVSTSIIIDKIFSRRDPARVQLL